MYLEYFQLNEFPFAITCDGRFFYESSVHAEALANMMYTAQQRKGMVLVTGEVGAGKTFLGSMLGERLGPSCKTVVTRNPPQSPKQLLRAVAGGVGLSVRSRADKLALVEELEDHLKRMHTRGRLVVLVVDEAQDLPAAALEELRLLWNWEQSGQRLVQIVLIGQPELRQKLLEPKWEPLRQRIVLSYHLGALSREDTEAYIWHRLDVASRDGCRVELAPEALDDIFGATDGIPRLINILCDNALLTAYANDTRRIDRSLIRRVLREMTCWDLQSPDARGESAATTATRDANG